MWDCTAQKVNIEVYGDKTSQVSITVPFVLKLIGSPVLNNSRINYKNNSNLWEALEISEMYPVL